MTWTIEYSSKALRTLRKLDTSTRSRIVDFMDNRVAIHPNPVDLAKPLSGKLTGKLRYRVGDYRIICSIEDRKMIILVIELGHRSEIYK